MSQSFNHGDDKMHKMHKMHKQIYIYVTFQNQGARTIVYSFVEDNDCCLHITYVNMLFKYFFVNETSRKKSHIPLSIKVQMIVTIHITHVNKCVFYMRLFKRV